jgi:flavin prenyltransferase
MSTWAIATLKYELPSPTDTASYISSLATHTYSPKDVSASLSSGSFPTDGMIIVPCSMKTLAGVRMGYDSDLIVRAASVTLKERRRLVLVARETPLSSLHLENMLKVSEAGAVVMPPCMAFYTRPGSVREMVEQSTKRMVDLLGVGGEEDEGMDAVESGGSIGTSSSEAEKNLTWTGFDWGRKKAEKAAG